jgi:hypothetical protein
MDFKAAALHLVAREGIKQAKVVVRLSERDPIAIGSRSDTPTLRKKLHSEQNLQG